MNNNYNNQNNMGYGQPQSMMNQQPMMDPNMMQPQSMMNQQPMMDPNMMQPQSMMNQQPMMDPNMMQPQSMMNQQPMMDPNMMQPQSMMNQQPMVDSNMMQPQPMMNQQPIDNTAGYNSNTMVNNLFGNNNANVVNNNMSQVPENMGKGLIGAICGALIGAIVLVVLYQVGKVAVVSGIAISALTILGYEKLGGNLNKKSLGICIIIMIATVFIGHTFGMAMYISSEFGKLGYDISTFEIFTHIFSYMEDGIIVSDVFWSNLLLNYLFCGIGGFFIVKDKFNQIKNS